MPSYSCPKSLTLAVAILCIVSWRSPAFSQQQSDASLNRGYLQSSNAPETKKDTAVFKDEMRRDGQPAAVVENEENLNVLQRQARMYRMQGVAAQQIGNIDAALAFYQKAIQLDPGYAIAYNDLGIIYEAKGFLDRAQESYLTAVKIAPDFMSPYTNLALFYENKRDLEKAAQYWKKRADLGSSDDVWTQKAQARYEDIRLVLEGQPIASNEQEIITLMRDVSQQKFLQRSDNKALAQTHFKKAKRSYEKGDEVTALKQAIDAKELDPSNKEFDEFIEKLQTRLLTR